MPQLTSARRKENRRVARLIGRDTRRRVENMRRRGASEAEVARVLAEVEFEAVTRELRGGSNRVLRAERGASCSEGSVVEPSADIEFVRA